MGRPGTGSPSLHSQELAGGAVGLRSSEGPLSAATADTGRHQYRSRHCSNWGERTQTVRHQAATPAIRSQMGNSLRSGKVRVRLPGPTRRSQRGPPGSSAACRPRRAATAVISVFPSEESTSDGPEAGRVNPSRGHCPRSKCVRGRRTGRLQAPARERAFAVGRSRGRAN